MSRAARLGAFIVATMAILIVGIFIIGGKQYLFSSTYQLKAQFDNVVGLDAGGDVRVGGVHSGTVRNILLPTSPAIRSPWSWIWASRRTRSSSRIPWLPSKPRACWAINFLRFPLDRPEPPASKMATP